MTAGPKRYLFIGAVEYSARCLRVLLDLGVDVAGILALSPEASGQNSDYADLGAVAAEYGRRARYFSRISEEGAWIAGLRPDVVFVLGLSQIIPPAILKAPRVGCIGSHPALLPSNRGRHPIVWAIANGLTESGVTLFWLDEGVDSGDIWAQERFEITADDDAASVYAKVCALSAGMLRANVPLLEEGVVNRRAQDHSAANYWRKRTARDGEIDWRMSSKRIYDLVRALASPYPGAHCLYQGREVKILKVRMAQRREAHVNIEPGKVLYMDGAMIGVKTGDGVLEIVEHGFDRLPLEGGYL